MAANLLAAGYELIVRDADLERERRFVAAHGGRGCDGDPAALAEAEILITMLPNGQVVRDALLGHDAIASRLRPGTIIVDTSSSDPYGTRELGSELAGLGLILLDSPVTRPEAVGQDTRRITFMVAGDDDAAIDRVMPLLQAMAERVFRAGRLGSGHAMKTLNNYVSAAGLAAALPARRRHDGRGGRGARPRRRPRAERPHPARRVRAPARVPRSSGEGRCRGLTPDTGRR